MFKHPGPTTVPITDRWNVYVNHVVVHIMDQDLQWAQKALATNISTDAPRVLTLHVIRVIEELNLKKPSWCPYAKEAVNCMRSIAEEAWSRYDLLLATLARINRGSLPHNVGTDKLWDVEMLDLRMLMGQLCAVKDILRLQAAERLTAASEDSCPVPALRNGGPPEYELLTEETLTEHSLRLGLNPSHQATTTIQAKAQEGGQAVPGVPATYHTLGFSLTGRWAQSLTPQRNRNGEVVQRRRSLEENSSVSGINRTNSDPEDPGDRATRRINSRAMYWSYSAEESPSALGQGMDPSQPDPHRPHGSSTMAPMELAGSANSNAPREAPELARSMDLTSVGQRAQAFAPPPGPSSQSL